MLSVVPGSSLLFWRENKKEQKRLKQSSISQLLTPKSQAFVWIEGRQRAVSHEWGCHWGLRWAAVIYHGCHWMLTRRQLLHAGRALLHMCLFWTRLYLWHMDVHLQDVIKNIANYKCNYLDYIVLINISQFSWKWTTCLKKMIIWNYLSFLPTFYFFIFLFFVCS